MQKLAQLLSPGAAGKPLWYAPLAFALKAGFFVISLAYLYFELHTKEALLPGIAARWADSWQQPAFLVFFALAPINWLLEALKWKFLMSHIERIRLSDALRGVLAGLAFSAFSHHLVGHYIGRLMHLRTDRRAYSLVPNLLGSAFQTYWSVFFGGFGLLLHTGWATPLYLWGYLFCNALFWLLVLSAIAWLKNAKPPGFLRLPSGVYPHLASLSELSAGQAWGALLASFARYCVYYMQFALLLGLFCPSLSALQIFTGVSLVYLGKTLVPKFNFLNDLGLREASAIYAFGNFKAPPDGLLAATVSLWLANLCLPMLAGAFLVFIPKYFDVAKKCSKQKNTPSAVRIRIYGILGQIGLKNKIKKILKSSNPDSDKKTNKS